MLFISVFSAILFFLAILPTICRRMPHTTIPLIKIRIVEASTIHPPHCTWGRNIRMSTKKASNDTIKVGRQRINKARRYLGECAGLFKCARTLRMNRINAMKAAIGWTISRFVSEFRAWLGSEKSDLPSSLRIVSMLYPMDTELQFPLFEHHPKTPNLTLLKVAILIESIIGVLKTLNRRSAKATKSSTLNGVAGRNAILRSVCQAIFR